MFLLLVSTSVFANVYDGCADNEDCDNHDYSDDPDWEYFDVKRENRRYYREDSDNPYYVRDMPGNRVLVAPREWWWLRTKDRIYW